MTNTILFYLPMIIYLGGFSLFLFLGKERQCRVCGISRGLFFTGAFLSAALLFVYSAGSGAETGAFKLSRDSIAVFVVFMPVIALSGFFEKDRENGVKMFFLFCAGFIYIFAAKNIILALMLFFMADFAVVFAAAGGKGNNETGSLINKKAFFSLAAFASVFIYAASAGGSGAVLGPAALGAAFFFAALSSGGVMTVMNKISEAKKVYYKNEPGGMLASALLVYVLSISFSAQPDKLPAVVFPFVLFWGLLYIFYAVIEEDFAGYILLTGGGMLMFAAGAAISGTAPPGALNLLICIMGGAMMAALSAGAGGAEVHNIRYRPEKVESHILALFSMAVLTAVQIVFIAALINGEFQTQAVKFILTAGAALYSVNILNGFFILMSGVKRFGVSIKKGAEKRNAAGAGAGIVLVLAVIMQGWFI
ncbi:MAG: hypothetical protein ACLFP1_03225 [Candidatus Goldiibacteriota bacterium]